MAPPDPCQHLSPPLPLLLRSFHTSAGGESQRCAFLRGSFSPHFNVVKLLWSLSFLGYKPLEPPHMPGDGKRGVAPAPCQPPWIGHPHWDEAGPVLHAGQTPNPTLAQCCLTLASNTNAIFVFPPTPTDRQDNLGHFVTNHP